MSLEISEVSAERLPDAKPAVQNPWLMLGLKLLWRFSRLLTVRNLVIVTVAALFAVILYIFTVYFAHLVFTKPKQVHEGGLAYSVFMSKFIKELPAFKPLENPPKYYFNIIGNADIPVYIVRYESHAPPEEIISYYRLYFEILNYSYVKHPFDTKALAMFRNTREGFTVFVSVGDGVNTVSIENFKYK